MSYSVEETLNEIVRYLNKPVWKATEYFLINDSSWTGIAYKAIGIVAALFSTPLAIAGETLHMVSQRYYRRSYLLYKGKDTDEKSPQKFLSLNACMFQGGLPVPFGGVRPAGARMDALAKLLIKQDADVVCLQEMAFDPATQLIGKIKDKYPFIYYRIGPNPYQMESALFFASKYPLQKPPQFIPFNIPGMQGGIRRGFFVAVFTDCYVITTHLDPGAKRGEIRAKQVEAILNHIETLDKRPLYLIGDLNIDPKDTQVCQLLKENFSNFKEEDVVNPTQENATCFDNISDVIRDSKLKPEWTVVDHILVKEHSPFLKIFEEKIHTFDPNNLPVALSDHHAVVSSLKSDR